MLVAMTAADTRKMAYCFSANEITYSTEFPSLCSGHPEICATFDHAYGSWLWQHSTEAPTYLRTRPEIMGSEIEQLNPVVTCYDANHLQIEPARSEWCSIELVGNWFTSADHLDTGMYVVLGVLCCLAFGFKIRAESARVDQDMAQS